MIKLILIKKLIIFIIFINMSAKANDISSMETQTQK